LPSWLVLLTVLTCYGWLDQVVDLLQRLSKLTRLYVRSPHRKMLQANVRVSRFHPRSYGFPDRLLDRLVKSTRGAGQSQFEALARAALLLAWQDKQLTSAHELMQMVVACVATFAATNDEVAAMVLEQADYAFCADFKRLVDGYAEFELHDTYTVVVTRVATRQPRDEVVARGVREILVAQRPYAVCWFEGPGQPGRTAKATWRRARAAAPRHSLTVKFT
jgi:hypothetical protein